MNTDNLNVGDEIAFSFGSYRPWNIRFDKVAKKTPKGMVVLENGKRFNKYGDEISSDGFLIDIEDAKESIAQWEKTKADNAIKTKFLNTVNHKLNFLSLDDKLLTAMKNITDILERK